MRKVLCSLSLTVFSSIFLFTHGARAQEDPEIGILQGIVQSHRASVGLTTLCLERATRPELLTFCQQLIQRQTAEILRARLWLLEWHDTFMAPEPTQEMIDTFTRVGGLTGASFERAVMAALAVRHYELLLLLPNCLLNGSRDELIGLCTDLFPVHAQEISTLRTWIYRWFF